MGLELVQLLSRGRLPKSDSLVKPSGRQPATIGRKRQTVDARRKFFQALKLSTLSHVPETDRFAFPRGQNAAVGRIGDRRDAAVLAASLSQSGDRSERQRGFSEGLGNNKDPKDAKDDRDVEARD